ncbi:uncharacterized protein LOC116128987 [Pistacia vera]|uniref:uncharacterized protein LOC116128987 n=1 Tax=Pistacia vera TaxID=55513 RepID=UPI0012634A1D|nr:uncharacterized protein LOC116128987 [Pistacia vera]
MGEPLREYVSRFNKGKISIPSCNPEIAIDAFRKGLLLNGELYKELMKLGCTTIEDALARAVIQIRWEEDEMNRSSKLNAEARRDTTKWYEVNGDHGHNIADCIALKLEVVALLKRGHLRDLLTDKGNNIISQKSTKETSPPPREPTPKGFCSIISRGSKISGVSYSSAKRYAKANNHHEIQSIHLSSRSDSHQVIQFEDDKPVTLAAPHHDALVISLQIANILVKRVFIDGGSSANILFLEVVKAMGLEEININKQPTILVGFSSKQKYTIGEIVLLVYASRVNKQASQVLLDHDLEMAGSKVEIEKFDGKCFELWKLQMEDLLVDRDLWGAFCDDRSSRDCRCYDE